MERRVKYGNIKQEKENGIKILNKINTSNKKVILTNWCPPSEECMSDNVCGPAHWYPPNQECHSDCCPWEPCPTKNNKIYENIFI